MMYADPSGYMSTMAELLTASNMQNILREASNIAFRTAIGGLIGGIGYGGYAAGDVLSEGGNWQKAWNAFCGNFLEGALAGATIGLASYIFADEIFAGVITALAFCGFTGSMYGVGVALSEGKGWQALYRFGVGTLIFASWYKMYGAKGEGVLQNVLKQLRGKGKSSTTTKVTSNLGNEIDITPSANHTTTIKNPGLRGTPNSSIDIVDSAGNIKTRRWFDSDGMQIRDVDFTNHGNAKLHPEWPHEHGKR